jgi:hypothetical protein
MSLNSIPVYEITKAATKPVKSFFFARFLPLAPFFLRFLPAARQNKTLKNKIRADCRQNKTIPVKAPAYHLPSSGLSTLAFR